MAPTLFTAATLTAMTGRPVTDDQAAAIHAWVVTVLEDEIGALPNPPPPGVTGVAIELGTAAVPTPGGATSTTLGSFSTTYPTNATSAALTRQQRHRLRRAAGKNQAFSITTTQTSRGAAR